MKPKDLKPVFSFEERRPLLQDHVFYVPIYYRSYEEFAFPPFSDYFGNQHPVCLEYCSGNGDWIIDKAKHNPHQNWIAVERRFDRVQKIWSKLNNHQLSNLLIVCGEAFTYTHFYIPNQSIEEIYINFPDPWPKAKHAKNRLIQPIFLDELSRILKKEKKVCVVTDDSDYLNQTLDLMGNRSDFKPFFPSPYYLNELPGYGSSWFETLWRDKGKQIHYTQFYTASYNNV